MEMAQVGEILPYIGMVGAQLAQVGLMIVGKEAIANGMSSFSFVFYSNALASLILLPPSLFLLLPPPNYSSGSSDPPQLSFSLLFSFVLLGFLGFYLHTRRPLQAKSIGTLVSITGAIVVTLYKGPALLTSPLHSTIPTHHLLGQPSSWVIGGLFLMFDCVVSSMFLIAQALILKKYSRLLVVIFSYCFVVAILCGVVSLIIEADLSTFSLRPTVRLLSVLYSGVFGSVFQVTVQAWCIRRKGPVFVAMFHPVGILISTAIGVIFLGDGFYLGGLVGSIVVVIGFYLVMWGKAKEVENSEASSSKLRNEKVPLLQDDVGEQDAPATP